MEVRRAAAMTAPDFLGRALAHPVAVLSVIGPHGGKKRDEILQAKQQDISIAQRTFWAFQSTAAPPPLVQQLAGENRGAPVLLIDPTGRSNYKPTSFDPARKFSADGKSWRSLPSNIGEVTGRLTGWGTALVLKRLDEVVRQNSHLDLWDYSDFVYPTCPVRIQLGASTICEALAALLRERVRVVMLTGDNKTMAQAVAKRLGITDVEAEVLPDQKSAVVEKLRKEGRVVAMAGDGVNDAPALAAAEVGIAMGTGTDVAIESAGVTLLKGDLTGIVRARRLSEATMRNIRQNLFFAFIYNAAGVPIAAGALYPAFGILLSPIIAAAAMALSSVSVVGNALRLRRVRL
jgi:hypothetical protein